MAVMERVGAALRSLAGAGRDAVVYECRRCGETLDGAEDACPNCGDADVARFRVD